MSKIIVRKASIYENVPVNAWVLPLDNDSSWKIYLAFYIGRVYVCIGCRRFTEKAFRMIYENIQTLRRANGNTIRYKKLTQTEYGYKEEYTYELTYKGLSRSTQHTERSGPEITWQIVKRVVGKLDKFKEAVNEAKQAERRGNQTRKKTSGPLIPSRQSNDPEPGL